MEIILTLRVDLATQHAQFASGVGVIIAINAKEF